MGILTIYLEKVRNDIIGHIIVLDIAEGEQSIFQEVMSVLEKHSSIKKYEMQHIDRLSICGLVEICYDSRRVYVNGEEVSLTAKEYDLLCLLITNRKCVLTYDQIYEKVWQDFSLGNERTTIAYHIYNLRKKLYEVLPDAVFEIRCIREVGYCFDTKI